VKISLKAARINAGLTQKAAAKKIGVSPDTLANYEKGVSFPDIPVIMRIEKTYGVEYADLIFLPKNYA
jgi:hypothetical protein